ncbi:MAG TPA: hypothetical protein PK455_05510, partial [Caldisericia bacterium]|nr:hypothetical protein [Caldisericia bacterium]
ENLQPLNIRRKQTRITIKGGNFIFVSIINLLNLKLCPASRFYFYFILQITDKYYSVGLSNSKI